MKEIKIVPPNGYVVDTEKSTFEKIVFKPIGTKPRNWGEFCKKFSIKEKERTINVFGEPIIPVEIHNNAGHRCINTSFSILPNGEYVTAFTALMQLISLRQVWIGDWKPDWNTLQKKYVIVFEESKIVIFNNTSTSHPLSFPTKEMAQEFLKCFKDLIEKAKHLL